MNTKSLDRCALVLLVLMGLAFERTARRPVAAPPVTRLDAAPVVVPASRGGKPEIRLQLALVQIAEQGVDEAVLCAAEVGLRRDESVPLQLKFGNPQPEGKPRPSGARQVVDDPRTLPASFGLRDLALDLDLVYVGRIAGLQTVFVTAQRAIGTRGLLRVPTLALRDGEPMAWLGGFGGLALFARLTTQANDDDAIGARAWWRDRFAHADLASPTMPQVEAVRAAIRVAADARRFTGVEWLPEPRLSAAVAALVLRDHGLAMRLRAQPAAPWLAQGRPELDLADDWKWCVRPQTVVAERLLASPTARAQIDTRALDVTPGQLLFGFERALLVRTLLLTDDADFAQALAEQLRASLRTSEFFVDLVREATTPTVSPTPAAAAAWNGLLDAAFGECRWPWSWAARAPWRLVAYSLLPLLLAVVAVCWRRSAGGGVQVLPLHLGVFLASGLLKVGGVPTRLVFAIALGSFVHRWLSVTVRRRDRWLAGAALTLAWIEALQQLDCYVREPALDVLLAGAPTLGFVVIGHGLLADGGWRALQPFGWFLWLGCGTWLLSLPGPPAAGPANGIVWIALACAAFTLLAGRRAPPSATVGDAAPAWESR